jgi:DoxX-like family
MIFNHLQMVLGYTFHQGGCMSTSLYVALTSGLGILMALAGSGKITNHPSAIAIAKKLDYTRILRQIGALELAGGVVAVTGNYFAFVPQWLQRAAVVGLCVILAGAILFHLKSKDLKGTFAPAALLLVGVFALSIVG